MKKLDRWLNGLDGLSKRDFSLIKKATGILMENLCEGPQYPWYPFRCIRPFGGANLTDFSMGIWNWDSAFHAIGVLRWDSELAKEQVLGFIQYQLEDGMYIDVKWANGGHCDCSSKPPVFAWAVAEIYDNDKDIEFVKTVYPSLVKNEEFWCRKRFYNGMFHYGVNINRTPFENLDRYVGFESGWDNSVRWDSPCADYWPIDLNCYMVLTYRSLAFLARALGNEFEARVFEEKEKILTENINDRLWNDEIKAYTDTNRFNGEQSSVLTPASYMPLFVNIADEARAECMAKFAKDKNKFYPGMPTVTYDDKEYSQGYWRGNTWLNVAYFAAKGLKNYGYNGVADDIKNEILGWVEKDGEYIHENYNSTTGQGLFCEKFSWSSVFVIEFILNF